MNFPWGMLVWLTLVLDWFWSILCRQIEHTTTFPTFYPCRAFCFSAALNKPSQLKFIVSLSGHQKGILSFRTRLQRWVSSHISISLLVFFLSVRWAFPPERDISFSSKDCEYSSFSCVFFRTFWTKINLHFSSERNKGEKYMLSRS